jgi:hypothetical protein
MGAPGPGSFRFAHLQALRKDSNLRLERSGWSLTIPR